MKTKALSFFLALIVLVSCSNNEEMRVINVDVDANDVTEVNDNLVIKTMLPLKYNDLIGEIRKLINYEDKYYLLDSKTQKILCFDNKGELVFEIASLGRGPEEYAGIQNFYINHINKTIELISVDKKLFSYNVSNGDFVKVEPLDFDTIMVLDGIQMGNGLTAYAELGLEFNVKVGDKQYIPFVQARDFTFSNNGFCKYGENALFAHGTDDNIYEITKDTVLVKYEVSFGDYGVPSDKYTSNPEQVQSIYESRSVATKIDDIINTNKYFSFSYLVFPPASMDVKTHYAIYDKTKNNTANILTDDIIFPIRASQGDSFISLAFPHKIINSQDNGLGNLKQLKECVSSNGLNEDSNPIIVIWKF